MLRTIILNLLFPPLLAASLLAQTQPGKTGPSKHPMPAANANEAAVREVYDRWAKAFEAKDVNAIMALYAPGDEVVAYDIVPPLQYKGKEAYRKDYEEFLSQYQGPIKVEYRDMRVVAGNHVAFVNALERLTGTLTTGQKVDMWVRATSGLRKIDGKWLIVHDHISVPADFTTGKALLELKP